MNLSRNQITMVVVLLFGALLVVLNATLLSSVLPTFMQQFGVSATTVQWLTSGYAMAEAVTVLLSAYLVGRFSTRKLFIGGLLLFTAGSVLAGIAPVFGVLLAGRMLQGVAAGVVMPMTFSLILLIFPRESRGSAMGLVTLVVGFAPAVGPTLGGIVSDVVGWRFLFAGVVVIALVVMAVGLKTLENFEGFAGYELDVPSVVLMVCGMVSMLYGISSLTSSENIAAQVALIVVGVLVLAVFVRRQLTLEQPMLNVTVLKSRRYRVDVIVVLILQAVLVGGGVILPLYVQNVLGYSATVSGLIMLPGALFGAFMGMLAGRLFDRYGVRGLVVVGVSVVLVAAVGTTQFSVESSVAFVAVVYAVLGIGVQTIITPLNTWGVNSLDNSVIQHANSLQNSLNQVAASVGTAFLTSLTALGPALAAQGTSFEQTCAGSRAAFVGLCALVALCAVIVYVCARNKAGDAKGIGAQPEVETREQAGDGERSWTVAEVMDMHPKCIHDWQTVGDAFDVFAATETSGVPVLDAHGSVVGYLSDGDVIKYLARQDVGFASGAADVVMLVDNERIQQTMLTLFDLPAMKLATRKVVTLDADMSLESACKVFADHHFKKAPVVRDGRIVGSLSRRNIVSFIADKAKRADMAGK